MKTTRMRDIVEPNAITQKAQEETACVIDCGKYFSLATVHMLGARLSREGTGSLGRTYVRTLRLLRIPLFECSQISYLGVVIPRYEDIGV